MITLGQASNYSAGQVWRHLWAFGTRRDFDKLRASLAKRYHAKAENVLLYHTGRSALTAAIQSLAPAGGKAVIIPGLTCIAVVRAVKAAGCTPVFVDITPQNLEYDYEKLEKVLELLRKASREEKHSLLSSDADSNISAGDIDKKDNVCYNGSIILIQNTLGFSWNAQKIEQIAQKYNADIVEDLAHSAGRFYADGREVGTVGATAALSFGKGKAIDTISGGAAILRVKPASQSVQKVQSSQKTDQSSAKSNGASSDSSSKAPVSAYPPQPTRKPKLSDRLRDRWYPVFGALSRPFGQLGCKLMGALVKIHFVQRSADAELDLSRRLTYWQAKLAYRQLQNLPQTPLRQFELVREREQVLAKWHEQGYYLDEIWYDAPVSPRRYYQEVDFPEKECPETVRISQQIVNFPTWYNEPKLSQAYAIAKPYLTKKGKL